jgi:hypothetical protein
MIKCAGDDRSQIMFRSDEPESLAEIQQFARPEQFVSASPTGKFHRRFLTANCWLLDCLIQAGFIPGGQGFDLANVMMRRQYCNCEPLVNS